MKDHLKIVGIAGSLRQKSYSAIVLRAIQELLPRSAEFTTLDIGSIPHYNEDLDHKETPGEVISARTAVADADLIVIVTPEFNHGVPGVLKNAIDWLSRPAFKSCFIDKPVFFLTLSEGALGGVRAQYQLRETLSSMLCRLPPHREVAITHVNSKVIDGVLSDASTLSFVDDLLQGVLTELARYQAPMVAVSEVLPAA